MSKICCIPISLIAGFILQSCAAPEARVGSTMLQITAPFRKPIRLAKLSVDDYLKHSADFSRVYVIDDCSLCVEAMLTVQSGTSYSHMIVPLEPDAMESLRKRTGFGGTILATPRRLWLKKNGLGKHPRVYERVQSELLPSLFGSKELNVRIGLQREFNNSLDERHAAFERLGLPTRSRASTN